MRLPGRGAAPARRHVDRRATESSAPARCCFANLFLRSRCSVDVAKAPSAQASRRTERVRRCACVGVTCAHALPLRLINEGPCATARKKRDRQRLFVLGVHPLPTGAGPPCYPYAKVINSARRDPQGFLWARRVPPPIRGRSPLLPVCKSYQQCKKRPAKSPFARRVPPPHPGQVPAITRMQKLSTVHKPTRARGCGSSCHLQSRTAVVLLGLTLAGPQICNGVSSRAVFAWRGRRLHNPQRPQELLASLTFSCAGVGRAAKRGVAKAPRPAAQTRVGQARVDVVFKQAAELSVGAALAWG